MSTRSLRIGFVSTRLAGTDGVSLESAKWARVLQDLGHTCFYFAGECDRPASCSRVVEEAGLQHATVSQMTVDLFDNNSHRSPTTTEAVHELRVHLKRELHRFIRDFDIELLKVENALSLPMNVPLGLAVTELIAETNIPTIAQHHDFYWERPRYSVNAAHDYLHAAFPPAIAGICHVVINSYAATELARRTGLRSRLIPNVMDFDNPSVTATSTRDEVRSTLGLAPDEVFLLQPTRVVPRKCIERSIEIARWLGRPASLVISHSAGDEGHAYAQYLSRLAKCLDVRLIFADEIFSPNGRTESPDRCIFSLADAYAACDIVTYPSAVEGFGNAFLEAIYYRKPLIMSGYEIFRTDIQPKGFRVIQMDGFVTENTLSQARQLLDDPALLQEVTEHNYQLGRRHYSHRVLRELVNALLSHHFAEL